jgi:hypothetical protein
MLIAAHKQRVWDAVDKCCTNLNLEYNSWKDHPSADKNNTISIYDKTIGRFISEYSVGAVNKFLPEWVWNLSPVLCKQLINGMMLGDGHTMENGTRRYDTSSKRLADDFQRLCLHAGYATNISLKYEAGHESQEIKSGKNKGKTITSTADAYRLTIIETQVEPLVNKYIKKVDDQVIDNCDKMIDFNGKVYCCTVDGEGVIYVRRNCIPVWSGNSRRKTHA